MKIAAAQIFCALGDLSANVQKIRAFAERAQGEGIELIVFPEMSDTGYAMQVIREQARPWDEGIVPELREIARTFSIAIVCGVSERESGSIFNSQVVLDAHGVILAKYRKTHLFAPAPIEEDKCCRAGSCLTSFDFGSFRIGLTICYDLRFPEVFRTLAVEEKCNLFIISSAWPFPRVEHLRTLTMARAIENQSYVILANRVGTDDGVQFCGSSAVIDPSGAILAEAATAQEELVVAEISAEAIEHVRNAMPVFSHRREDLYPPRPPPPP